VTEKKNTLPPRLKSRILIDKLFSGKDSKTTTIFPLRAVYCKSDEDDLQLLFSVSKRHFKRAVKRNRVKRQMREAFRLNKAIIGEQKMHIAFVWLADKLYPSDRVHKAMTKLLEKINHTTTNVESL